MGASKSKPMREAPARFVAKQLQRETKAPEDQFRKPEYTKQGINKRLDNTNTEPLMYVETEKDENSTEVTDHTAPRWYLNTYMELVDNCREDRTIISGNLPASWERDKNEPYGLVRGRIDEEDLDWLLHPDQKKMSIDELLTHSKLDRETIEDLLAHVELARPQYRNYQGKIHKTIDDSENFLDHRNKQIEHNRETEVLKTIGFSDEEIANDEQYRTKRSRGVKALDDLGASIRSKKRMDKSFEQNEMRGILDQERISEIEAGTYVLTDDDVKRDNTPLKSVYAGTMTNRSRTQTNSFRMDIGADPASHAKIDWWMSRSRRIKRGNDKIHGVPVYNERVQANEEQTQRQMQEAADFQFQFAKRQGAKGYIDPRGQYDEMMEMMRNRQKEGIDDTGVYVTEDDEKHIVDRFPHTKDHPAPPKQQQPPVSGSPIGQATTEGFNFPYRK